MFSGNKEEGAFCFFIFWTRVSGEDLQSTFNCTTYSWKLNTWEQGAGGTGEKKVF